MQDCFSDYADNYIEYRDFIYSYFADRPITDGYDAQREGLEFLDESTLTERERFIMVMSVIKWEIEHDMLTPELEGELDYYYDEFVTGRLAEHINSEDVEPITTDLIECYKKIFE